MKKITKILLAAIPTTVAAIMIPSVTITALRNNSQSSFVTNNNNNNDNDDKDNSSSDNTNNGLPSDKNDSTKPVTNNSFSWKVEKFDQNALSYEIKTKTPIIDLSKVTDTTSGFGKETKITYASTAQDITSSKPVFDYFANRVNVPTGYTFIWNVSWSNKYLKAITDVNGVRTTNVVLLSYKCYKTDDRSNVKWINVYVTNFTKYSDPKIDSAIASKGINISDNSLANIGLPKNSSINDLTSQISLGSRFINYLDSKVSRIGYDLSSVSFEESSNDSTINVKLTYKSYKGIEKTISIPITGYSNLENTQIVWLKGLFPSEATTFETKYNDPIIDLSKLNSQLGNTGLTKDTTLAQLKYKINYETHIPKYFLGMTKIYNNKGYNFSSTPFTFPSGVTNVEGIRTTKVLKFSIQFKSKGKNDIWKTVYLVNWKN